jgi:hypothetical protein
MRNELPQEADADDTGCNSRNPDPVVFGANFHSQSPFAVIIHQDSIQVSNLQQGKYMRQLRTGDVKGIAASMATDA